ncbi:MAG: sulfotransferase [Desulfotignum sp.]|nr:sulfotransferase [Desulfotignum sp.]
MTVQEAVSYFVTLEKNMAAACAVLSDDEKLIQRHEDLIADPQSHFCRMFDFLGVDPLQEVVAACAGKIWNKASKTRSKVVWHGEELQILQDCVRKSSIFNSYTTDVEMFHQPLPPKKPWWLTGKRLFK